MKIHPLALGFFVTSWLAGSGLRAQEIDLKAQLDQIREVLKPADADSAETKELKGTLQRYPEQWQRLIDQGQLMGFSEYGVVSANTMWAKIPGLTEKIQELTKSVAEEAARRDAAKIADAETLISRVVEVLKNAKKAEELDALMLALSKSKVSEYGNNPKLQATSRELQGALQIVGNWQEYLIAEETGNSQTRRSHLQQISSQLATTPILPRSIVLRLLNPSHADTPLPTVQKPTVERVSLDVIQSKLTESGDSTAILAELNAIPEEALRNSDNSSFVRTVRMVEDLRMLEPAMSEAEVFANIRSIQNNTSQNRFTFSRAIDQIALNAIARSYGIESPSAKTTSARKVLESIATDATSNKDWTKLRKAINSLDSVGSNAYGTDSHKRINDLKILSLLELGETAQKRNDLEAATHAYIEASSLDGQYLQREVAYGKIADLKQESPEKVSALLAKASEIRERSEIARQTAELESRERMMMNRGMPTDRLRREDLTAMKPLVQEVVAEFLKGKRLEAPKAAEAPKKPQP
jgi:uncharacterized protein (DUF2267 family)